MATQRIDNLSKEPKKPRQPPDRTVGGREAQLAALAYDLVEARLRDKTATSQETTYFLKYGSPREKLEREKLELENQFLKAKTEAMASLGRVEELMSDAINAFRGYSGQEPIPELENQR